MKPYTSILILVCCISFMGCKKYLDAKPDDKLTVPRDLSDLQSLLDYNTRVNWNEPSAGESSSDNYYLTNADWSALSTDANKRLYTWANDYLFAPFPNGWSQVYDGVFIANTVLDNIVDLSAAPGPEGWANVKGQALYLRSKCYLEGAMIWCPAYDPVTADKDLGLPLRTSSDFNVTSQRSSVRQTYAAIIAGLKESIRLLPIVPLHVLRSSRAAAYGMLSRTYLCMRDYPQAGLYADSCLMLGNRLLDYNTLNVAATYPVTQFNVEVVMSNRRTIDAGLAKGVAKIDSLLYASYAANDLRKTVFFQSNNNGTYGFKGSYEASQALFCGIAIDEMYLNRAECNARAGDKVSAIADLNLLLKNRWKTGTFIPLAAIDAADALQKILIERRKELLMRGLRWIDLKRFNKEGANITLTRKLDQQVYSLSPNDLRYALPIPENVILISGMEQNPR